MSRMFGFMANEPDRLRCALHPARDLLAIPVDPDGWGLGFYQGGEVLLTKRPKPLHGKQAEVYDLLRDVRAETLIGFVRTEHEAEPAPPAGFEPGQNPFRFRQWLFASTGSVPGFDGMKGELIATVPDFLRRSLRGITPSEHLFYLYLAFLHDATRLDDPGLTPGAARESLVAMTTFVDKLAARTGVAAPTDLSILATNGRILVASRRGRTMLVRRQVGYLDCPICRESHPEQRGRRVSHDLLRSVLVVSEPSGELPGAIASQGSSSSLTAGPIGPGGGSGTSRAELVAVPDGGTVAVSHQLTFEIA